MRFSKNEKEIIKAISERRIYDIQSFVLFSQQFTFEKADKQYIQNCFVNDKRFEKTYYFPKGLSHIKANSLSLSEYKRKINEGKISPQAAKDYVQYNIKISYDSGCLCVLIEGKEYYFDFYEGILLPNDFDSIFSFLIIWQYLKSEMLIFESRTTLTNKSLSIFCEKNELAENRTIEEIPINYDSMTVSDSNYLTCSYRFSKEHYDLCKEFVDKHIFPSAKLNLFVKNGFKTSEERVNKRSLVVACVAIIVSIVIAILSIIISITSDKSNEIIEKLDRIIFNLEDSKATNIEDYLNSIENEERIQNDILSSIDRTLSESSRTEPVCD